DAGRNGDATSYVAEVGGNLDGAGGSRRRSAIYGQGNDQQQVYLDASAHAARTCPSFVHPHSAARGIAHGLLYLSEAAADRAGLRSAELLATWKRAPIFQSCGYTTIKEVSVTLPDGVTLTGLYMTKGLD